MTVGAGVGYPSAVCNAWTMNMSYTFGTIMAFNRTTIITQAHRVLAIGPVLIFIAAVLWGLDGVFRRSLYSLHPSVIVFYEHLLGSVILLPFLLAAWKGEVVTRLARVGTTLEQVAHTSKRECIGAFFAILTPREWVAVGAVSLCSGLLGTLLFTSALAATQYISFSVVYLVQKLQPLFVIAVSSLLLREKPAAQYYVWAGVALVAGYFVTFPYGVVNVSDTVAGSAYGLSLENGHVWAALLALGAAASWGSSTAISRYALLHHNTTLITGLRFFVTVPLAFIAVLLLAGFSTGVNPLALSVSAICYLLIIALSTGMFALWIYYKGLQKTPAAVSAIVELAFPLTAVGMDYFLYGTILTPYQCIAGAVLLYAAYRVARLYT